MKKHAGYLLMEVALVLSLTALVMVPVLQLLKSQSAQKALESRQEQGPVVMQAIEAFVLTKGRLPCPANNRNGEESRLNGRCLIVSGWVPSQSLGLAPQFDWNLAVATLSAAGSPASDALSSDQPFAVLGPHQLAEVIYTPTTATQTVGNGALPAIHVCKYEPNQALPSVTQAGCAGHALYSASAVLVAAPRGTEAETSPLGGLNQNRSLQFFIHTDLQHLNPLWLSFERLNWLWIQSGAMSKPQHGAPL